jgi:hypothetical protein
VNIGYAIARKKVESLTYFVEIENGGCPASVAITTNSYVFILDDGHGGEHCKAFCD